MRALNHQCKLSSAQRAASVIGSLLKFSYPFFRDSDLDFGDFDWKLEEEVKKRVKTILEASRFLLTQRQPLNHRSTTKLTGVHICVSVICESSPPSLQLSDGIVYSSRKIIQVCKNFYFKKFIATAFLNQHDYPAVRTPSLFGHRINWSANSNRRLPGNASTLPRQIIIE